MASTVLEAFKQAKTKQFEQIAEDIVKYQHFKTSIAVKKIRGNQKESTKASYLSCGRKYILTNEKCGKMLSDNFYQEIQKCLDRHVQPLTPKAEEKYIVDYTKKEVKSPIEKILPKEKITTKIEYGILLNDKIMLEQDEQHARTFLKGVKFVEPNTKAKLVTVEIKEVIE